MFQVPTLQKVSVISQHPESPCAAATLICQKRLEGAARLRWGTQVNVITECSSGTVGQLNMKNTSTVVSHASKELVYD